MERLSDCLKKRNGFKFKHGYLQLKFMTFVFLNVLELFQLKATELLGEFQFVGVYIGDIFVRFTYTDEHIAHLKAT